MQSAKYDCRRSRRHGDLLHLDERVQAVSAHCNPSDDRGAFTHDEHRPRRKPSGGPTAVAPLVLESLKSSGHTGSKAVVVYHGAAMADPRKGGVREYTDEAVNDPHINVCGRGAATVMPRFSEDQTISRRGPTADDFPLSTVMETARPLSDRQLEAKFKDQPCARPNRGRDITSGAGRSMPGRLGELVRLAVP